MLFIDRTSEALPHFYSIQLNKLCFVFYIVCRTEQRDYENVL